jgi:hypothetical protein
VIDWNKVIDWIVQESNYQKKMMMGGGRGRMGTIDYYFFSTFPSEEATRQRLQQLRE